VTRAAFILAIAAISSGSAGSTITSWLGAKTGWHRTWWPNGHIRTDAHYAVDAIVGEFRSYYSSGQAYELRHYVNGHEEGTQQSWTEDGNLFLNYEVRNGRRYGLVNAKPCVPARALKTQTETLPFYDSADFTPRWTDDSNHHIAPFSLRTQTGATLTADDLRGHVHIANFMFTRCPNLCPAVVASLKSVQTALRNTDVVLVSYSVTPEVDTPELLASFGAVRGIDPSRWLLVTGDRRQIYDLARSSYFADDAREGRKDEEILHSEKVLLVDQEGRLRGVYNGTQKFDMERLIRDIRTLTGM
jgi:protein SCO1/2